MNVLIIDDDAEDTFLFCEALKDILPNANCRSIDSCEKVKEALADVRPNIIFLDGHMYPTSGKECLKQLNQIVDRTQIKVFIHSGSLSPEERREFEEAGVDGILMKGFSYEELKTNIERALATVDRT